MYLLSSAEKDPNLWITTEHKTVDKLYSKIRKKIKAEEFEDEYSRLYVNTIALSILHELFPQGRFNNEIFLMDNNPYADLIRTAVNYVNNKELVLKGKKNKRYLPDGGFIFEDTTRNE